MHLLDILIFENSQIWLFQIIIENKLKVLGFIEQRTPEEEDLREEDLISEILGYAEELPQPETPEDEEFITDCFGTPHKRKKYQIK